MKERSVMRKARITLIISGLSAGGAERVLANMANYWVANGSDVTIISFSELGNDFYPLDCRVKRITINGLGDSLSVWRALLNNFRRIFRVRSAILSTRSDVVISFLCSVNVLAIAATRTLSVPVIVSERNNPLQRNVGRIWELLRRRSYPLAEAVVVQTEAVRSWAVQFVPEAKVHVISNPVPVFRDGLPTIPVAKFGGRFVVAAGRFVEQKGFDLLLQAFSRSDTRETHNLVILGEGPLREGLEKQVCHLGLEGRVFMPGRVADPVQVFRRAELFALSSRYEGFPNVLLEAMSCGLPVVSFDCPHGPREITRDGERGVLVPNGDINAFAGAMDRLMDDPQRRHELATRAEGVNQEYQLERIMRLWDETVDSVLVHSAQHVVKRR